MKRRYPDGIALEPGQIDYGGTDADASELFVTMCFYARLGFVQPPSCLKCAYRKSNCGKKNNAHDDNSTELTTSCNNLVPWRKDANVSLHPNGLCENLIFVTCNTAKSLIHGDAYPSIQWDNKNRRILYEMQD